jgi:hypothetical protein
MALKADNSFVFSRTGAGRGGAGWLPGLLEPRAGKGEQVGLVPPPEEDLIGPR